MVYIKYKSKLLLPSVQQAKNIQPPSIRVAMNSETEGYHQTSLLKHHPHTLSLYRKDFS
jgi:hypothetical protein